MTDPDKRESRPKPPTPTASHSGNGESVDPLVSRLTALFGGEKKPSSAKLVGIDDREEVPDEPDQKETAASPELELRFHRAMVELYRRAKAEVGYNATRFISMVSELGGAQTARILLDADNSSEGFMALVAAGRPDLTVEALVLDRTYAALFSDEELETASRRLARLK